MRSLLELLHRVAAYPRVYDLIQQVAGQKKTFERLAPATRELHARCVLDVGGGTGIWRRLWPEDCRYVCLDIEMPKLRGFRAKHQSGFSVLGNATQMPIADGIMDIVVCIAVIHHLPDIMFNQLLDEAYRVLRRGGHVVVLDPVLNRKRMLGLALWKLDRGSNPRTAAELRKRFESKFEVLQWENYAVYHEYVLGIGVRR